MLSAPGPEEEIHRAHPTSAVVDFSVILERTNPTNGEPAAASRSGCAPHRAVPGLRAGCSHQRRSPWTERRPVFLQVHESQCKQSIFFSSGTFDRSAAAAAQ